MRVRLRTPGNQRSVRKNARPHSHASRTHAEQARTSKPAREVEPLLQLQRQYGNRYVQRFLVITQDTFCYQAANVPGAKGKSKRKWLKVDLSDAVLRVIENGLVTKTMMVIFGKATKRLLKGGLFRIGKWYERYTTPSRTDYTACTWFKWGHELDRLPTTIGEVGFVKVKGRLHPVRRTVGGGIVYEQVSRKEVQRYKKMESEYQEGKRSWEDLAVYKLTRWDVKESEFEKFCNPFGKYATAIKGKETRRFMLHGTSGEDGEAHPFEEMTLRERQQETHGCIRTSNTDIEWLKANIPGGTTIRVVR